MPLVPSDYYPKNWFKNGHFSTIFSAKFRFNAAVKFKRQRLELSDGDFIDLDWSYAREMGHEPNHHVVILLHGLEGNAQRSYIRGQAQQLLAIGFDVCAMNFRGCSGVPNRMLQSYNAGQTQDLDQVIIHVSHLYQYQRIFAVGFSLGGSLLLNYLGQKIGQHNKIFAAAVVSTPLDLSASIQRLSSWDNRLYQWVFLSTLKKKYREKQRQFPMALSLDAPKAMRTLKDFDNLYTAPVHGYLNAEDYYNKNSPIKHLERINIPLKILNALNDTFLSKTCIPIDLAQRSKNIYLEAPKHGGHVGFCNPKGAYYNEKRIVQFLINTLD